MLDLISSIMLASSLGVGVLLSSVYYWLYVNSWGGDKTQIIGSCRSKSLRHDFCSVPGMGNDLVVKVHYGLGSRNR